MIETKMPKTKLWQLCGRGERIRTFDPLVPNQMRYQAALRPDSGYSNRLQQAANGQALRNLKPLATTTLIFMARPPLHWLDADDPFPALDQAWGDESDAPGLLAAGGSLDVHRLQAAYVQGIFPWYSEGQPILWWSPDPRMVLQVANFRLHRSFKKTLSRFTQNPNCEIRVDTSFNTVIRKCAQARRHKQDGTWILTPMIEAYCALHAQGLAHSIETWVDGQLVAGLYCVAVGQAVFGESMFSECSDGSKIALAALVAFCKYHGVAQVDCQQNTRHLASLGAAPLPRARFVEAVEQAARVPALDWRFSPQYWKQILSTSAIHA